MVTVILVSVLVGLWIGAGKVDAHGKRKYARARAYRAQA